MDEGNIPNVINYNLIKVTFNIGSAPARNLANYYQSELSKLSCTFIVEQSTCISNPSAKDNYIVSLLVRIGDRGGYALPYYYVTKVLLAANAVSIPLVFSFYYKENHQQIQQVLF